MAHDGVAQAVPSRLIETDYYFAVVAVDRANNRSENIATRADVVYPLPTDWLGAAHTNSLIRDLDGDGYSDIGVGEYNPDQDYPGRVLVLW